ncbi:NAD(P)-binding domain-containing protein [Bradyrhizobium iriomotense]|uniref:NAD(P)-binding domain-containing protein n=1 Tax=Bradyrhizobium iriomotense TaxID=441950 RepID=UPI001B89E8CE|nr:NAD(P)-binding domain-containing protein [Bradyrhizobium iriomotense]MBR1132224.1 NAD(P)/FAD-dependent oxidoreductase [Bradyrhizobium iriomotense]
MVGPSDLPVAIVGAGPFGLSVAAHLRSRGVRFRIFGTPMHRWRAQMPLGMFLKSEWEASSISDPAGRYTLRQFCAEARLPYGKTPLPLDTFTRYAMAFQQHLVPMVEDVLVTAVDRKPDCFDLRLATGERLGANSVVIATGLSHAEYVPQELTQLPAQLRSHSSAHRDLSLFKGRDVVVVGAGQSALETAALLNEAQARVSLFVRGSSISWNETPLPDQRSLSQRLRRPASPLGSGLKTWFCANAPMLFYYLPQRTRLTIVRGDKTHEMLLGPAGAWWLRERVLGRIPILLGQSLLGVAAIGGKAVLHVTGPDGRSLDLAADHIIAATGFRFAARSLPFLSEPLLRDLRCVEQVPILSPHFESSVPGLYFTGIASAYNFGSVMRFLCGCQYTAERICDHLGGRQVSSRSPYGVTSERNPKVS